MSEKEKSASALASSNAQEKEISVNNIPQQGTQSQAQNQVFLDGGLKRHKSDDWLKKRHPLPETAKVNSLAIKCYDEQLEFGWDYTCKSIQITDKKDFQVIAICHDRDTYADEGHFWDPADVKRHFHIIVRCVDSKKRIRVKQILNGLGIKFRPHLDDEMWANHGVETVGKFTNSAVYLTHETEKAIADGKELYYLDELVSNLTIEEIENVREGYLRVSENARKVTTKDLVELDDIAFNLGYEMKSFDDWYDSLPFNFRSNAKMKTIRESYDRGVKKRISEKIQLLRLCVFIEGVRNSGKTYAAEHALSGRKILNIGGGGSGKFDDLKVDTDAIIIDDDVCPNLLNVSDNYICHVYRRNSNNPVWTGKYLIVTSNFTFEEWLENCHISKTHYDAVLSRFYVCELKENPDGTNRLALKSPSNRGTSEEQLERAEMFMDFQKKYNQIMKIYSPSAREFDYTSMIDISFKADYKKLAGATEKDFEEYTERYIEYAFEDYFFFIHLVEFDSDFKIMSWDYESWLQCKIDNDIDKLNTVVYYCNNKTYTVQHLEI